MVVFVGKRAYPYVRFSSEAQSKGDSLRRQLREAREWCQRHGAVLDESLGFLTEEGQSARYGDNLADTGGLGMFLAYCKAGKIAPGSLLLVEKLDRYSRTDIDIAVAHLGQVLRQGIVVVSMRSGMVLTLETLQKQPTMMLPAVLELILAAEESVKKADRLASVWIHKREQARDTIKPMSARCPVWLRIKDVKYARKDFVPPEGWTANIYWEVLEDKADIVRRIFRESLAGLGVCLIAQQFNEEGVPTLDGSPAWTQRMLHRVLNNPCTYGAMQPQRRSRTGPVDEGGLVENYFPEIVSRAHYFLAQQMSSKRQTGRSGGRTGRYIFLFQHLAYDQATQSTLIIKSSSNYGQGYTRYLIPSSNQRSRTRGLMLPAQTFEEAILLGLTEIRPADILGGQDEDGKAIADVAGRLAEVAHRIEEAEAAMEDCPPSALGTLLKKIGAWQDVKAALAVQLDELKARQTVSKADMWGEMKGIIPMLRECQGDECVRLRLKLRAVIRALVKKVTLSLRPGRTRLEKACAAVVEFHHSEEKRVFIWAHPNTTGKVVVLMDD